MEIVIDFSPLLQAADQGGLALALYFFTQGAWIIYAIIIIYGFFNIRQMMIQQRWHSQQKFMLLAIDVPKNTEQTAKAVEQLFATLTGAHEPLSRKEIYVKGKVQLSFSFEIVSLDGYVQFLVRTPVQWRDLVESSVYSQYPDAEITEVEDYTTDLPSKFPDEKYKIWGAEVKLDEKDVLPIRTYTQFEDSVSGEFKDPLASLIETMSKIKIGEQVWLQIIVKPTGFTWPERSYKEAYKIAGKSMPSSQGIISRIFSPITNLFFLSSGESIFWPTGAEADKRSSNRDELPSLMLHLTPGERETIEAIENKASKIGFECKIRLIYISTNELYQPSRVVSSVFGSIKQFNTLDLNSFKPDKKTKTKAEYFFPTQRVNSRRGRIMRAYKARSTTAGLRTFILNTEELATIWHFPSREIKAPLLQRTEAKKSEPPSSLPVFTGQSEDQEELANDLRAQLGAPVEFSVDLDNKYFEEKFAKDKSKIAEPARQKGKPPVNLPT